MIARIWHGMVPAEKAAVYHEFLKGTGIKEYQETEGNLGVYVMQRIEGDIAHFTLLTFWESEEAIKRFAGDDISIAHYYPEDKDFLLEFEPNVVHHDVIEHHVR